MNDSFAGGTGPLVSAIVATYNRAYILCEAIDSILNQTYRNTEVLIVDDGSTDDTREKLKRYGTRIRIISQKNSGPAAAWNRGIEESRGKIVAFLGSDDIWLPKFLERQVSLFQRAGEDIACSLSNCWLSFATGKRSTSFQHASLYPLYEEGIWLNPAEILASRFVVFGQTVAIRREALDKSGRFDESLWFLEDYDLALKLSIMGSWGFIREPLVVWRQGTTDSLSQKSLIDRIQLRENSIKIRERILGQLAAAGGVDRIRALHRRELRLERRELWSARINQNRRWGGAVNWAVTFGIRCANFFYRRSSNYPGMRTADLHTEDSIRADARAMRRS